MTRSNGLERSCFVCACKALLYAFVMKRENVWGLRLWWRFEVFHVQAPFHSEFCQIERHFSYYFCAHSLQAHQRLHQMQLQLVHQCPYTGSFWWTDRKQDILFANMQREDVLTWLFTILMWPRLPGSAFGSSWFFEVRILSFCLDIARECKRRDTEICFAFWVRTPQSRCDPLRIWDFRL